MTAGPLPLVFLVPFVVLVVLALVAVATDRRRLLVFAKPLATLALLPLVGAPIGPLRALIMVGLVLSAAGDAALVFDEDARLFIGGLVLFALAHVAYVAAWFPFGAASAEGFLGAPLVIFGALSAALVWALWSGLGGMRGPVLFYAVLITSMVVVSMATLLGSLPLGAAMVVSLGSLLFYASDALLAWRRFRGAFRGSQELTLVLYWLGQLGLALGARWT